jgi:hypothetical protein
MAYAERAQYIPWRVEVNPDPHVQYSRNEMPNKTTQDNLNLRKGHELTKNVIQAKRIQSKVLQRCGSSQIAMAPAPTPPRYKKKLPIVLTIMTEGKPARVKKEICRNHDKLMMNAPMS